MSILTRFKRFAANFRFLHPVVRFCTNFKGELRNTRGYGVGAYSKQIFSPTVHQLTEDTDGPYYQTDFDTIANWYDAHRAEVNRDEVLYVGEIAIQSGNTKALDYPTLDLSKLRVTVLATPYLFPVQLHEHRTKMVRHIRDVRGEDLRDGPCIRVKDIDVKTDTIIVQKATYFDQIGTNLTLDTVSEEGFGKTPRQWEHDLLNSKDIFSLPALGTSNLANTLGVATLVVHESGRVLWRKGNKKGKRGIAQDGWQQTVGGVCDPAVIRDGQGLELIVDRMYAEIQDEMFPDEFFKNHGGQVSDFVSIYPVCFARELPRGGKPQLFFLGEVKGLSIKELEDLARNAKHSSEFLNDQGVFPEIVRTPATRKEFTYEGYACGHYCDAFVQANTEIFPSIGRL